MTKKDEQALFDVYPVAWHKDKPTKFQARGSFRGKTIYGDPQPSEEEAVKSLDDEIELWYSAVIEIAARFDERFPKEVRPCRN